MLHTLKDYWSWRKFNIELRKVQQRHDRLIREAKKTKKSEQEIQDMVALMYHECELIERDIKLLITHRLLRTANRLSLPIPAWNDKEMWEEDYGDRCLTVKGAHTMKKRIRDERKEIRDFWLPWVCGITGLLGTLIGLASFFLRK